MNPFDALMRSPLWSQTPLVIVANVVVMLAFVLIAAAIIIDFVKYHGPGRQVVAADRSFVETGSMAAFFACYYLVIRFRLFEADLSGPLRTWLIVVGLLAVVLGVAFNIWGRLVLKSYWANQIRIYEGQRLLTTGPFAIVRHPLYASLIWIFAGGALIYANPLSLLLTLSVFVPMMYVRAKKEDAVLRETFGAEHERYMAATGMFMPRVRRRS